MKFNGLAWLLIALLVGQSTFKSYHKMQIDREWVTLAVYVVVLIKHSQESSAIQNGKFPIWKLKWDLQRTSIMAFPLSKHAFLPNVRSFTCKWNFTTFIQRVYPACLIFTQVEVFKDQTEIFSLQLRQKVNSVTQHLLVWEQM